MTAPVCGGPRRTQTFRFDAILAAHRAASGQALTDDAAVAEHAGLAVALVLGHEDNIKITSREDLDRAARSFGSMPDIRVGNGYDVHRFGPGNGLMLCGVAVPHEQGLLGHSDADVGLHAITDALLGAIGDGDIGMHFPPTDPRWKGADSSVFLRHALSPRRRARGGRVTHVDVTVICERPKVGSSSRRHGRPYRRDLVARCRARQRQGNHHRRAGLYRSTRRHRRAGDRDDRLCILTCA